MNAADQRRGEKDVLGPLGLEEGAHGGLVLQVQLGVGAQHEVGVPLRLQVAQDRAADKAAVAGDVDAGVGKHHNRQCRMPAAASAARS